MLLKRLVSELGDLLWPPRCIACSARGSPLLCRWCTETLVEIPPEVEQRLSFSRLPAWAEAHSRFLYGGQLAVAIQRCKHGDAGSDARLLGRLLRPLPPHDLAVPIPLHRARLRRRGFNQAAELARGAGAALAVRLLVRTRDTPSQGGLGLPERQANVERAFAVRSPSRLHGRRILLVDDVMTTGATAHACAQALLEAGAARVELLTLARADLLATGGRPSGGNRHVSPPRSKMPPHGNARADSTWRIALEP